MPDNDQEPASSDAAEGGAIGLAEAVTREREARRTRRRQERERQRDAVEARRQKRIDTDLITVSGRSETRTQRGAYTSARVEMWAESRRIVSTITIDGALKTEVFGFADGQWTSLGAIALEALSA